MGAERRPSTTKKRTIEFPMDFVSLSREAQAHRLEEFKNGFANGRGVVMKNKLYLDYNTLWKDLPKSIKSEYRNISDERPVSDKDFM